MTYIGDSDLGGGGPNGIDWRGGAGNWGIAKYGDDSRAVVLFYKHSIHNPTKSLAAGRRVYDEVDHIKIQHPGEREQIIDREVRPEDTQRYPRQWAAYQQNREQVPDGTPIDLLFPMHPSIADNLKAVNVLTVEQLANLSGSGMSSVGMGAQDYVNYAKKYLDFAQRGVGFHQLQKLLEERDGTIRTMGQEVALLKEQLTAVMSRLAPTATSTFVGAPLPPVAPAPPASALPPLPSNLPTLDAPTQKHRGWPKGKSRKPAGVPEGE